MRPHLLPFRRPGALALSGSMTEQATLGTSRPRYALKLNASAEAGYEGLPVPSPTYSSSFGSAGTGSGQFSHPGDVAIDPSGNLWVVDENNNRIEKFNEKSEFLAQYGFLGSGNGQFSRPTAIAIDAGGNVYVTDAGNKRVQKLNPSGEYLSKFGSAGTGNGQFAGGGPEGIAIDPKGNIYVADTYGGRLEKFNEKGEFLKAVGSLGSAPGQLVEPTGIDIAAAGTVWVADWANNRVEVYNEAGEYVRQFGSEGTGNGQFKRPDAVAIGPKGEVWIGDQNNGRVQQFNQAGEYVAKFGSPGSGTGQFNFGYPMGIAADSKGTLWITDTGNNRVQRWQVPGYAPEYSSAFGSAGSGSGQFSHPAGVAVDAKGNTWVVDEEHYRVEKFNEAGEYLSSFGSYGSGNGQFGRPTDIAIDANGNILVTDVGFNRVEKFTEKGEFLSQFGSEGTAIGKFRSPQAIAVAPNGTIWVADSENSRLQAFNEKGEFLRTVGSSGFGEGKFLQPRSIAVDADGRVWATDIWGQGVSIWSESGTFIRRFTWTASSIDIDPWGHVWLVEEGYGRVREYSQAGEYLAQFGTAGTGTGQFSFSSPTGIATDSKGRIVVSDQGNNRVQTWTQQPPYSEITTEITVDGNRADSRTAGCAVEHCALQREWMLSSPTYSVGPHTVIAKATDGFGNTTTKSLAIEVQRDTTKPSLEVSGGLFNAPEGWVEQESYGLSATAGDSGYGATFLAFKIDGELVASASQGCVDGGCEESLSKSLNMELYSGGSHESEIVAVDGAGNAATRKWTINVDPDGHITATEVEETLQAVDETAESSLVVATQEALSEEERVDGNDPTVIPGEEGWLETSGVPDPSAISIDPADGFEVILPDNTMAARPTAIGSEYTDMQVVEDAAAISGNTTSSVDTIVRPSYNGVTAFQSIRSKESGESFSWTVDLGEGQTLRSLDPLDAEVDYEDGHPAYVISAEKAHDAVGTQVPTDLAVTAENVVTLTVEHREADYVYPVVAGAGWEGGYTTEFVVGPKDEQEIREERERIAREEWEALQQQYAEELEEGGPDESAGSEYENIDPNSDLRPRRIRFLISPPEMVDWVNRKRRSKANPVYCAWLTCDVWRTELVGTWFWNGTKGSVGGFAWRGNTVSKCSKSDAWWVNDELLGVGWSGANPAPYGYGQHLTLWCNFVVKWVNTIGLEENHYHIHDHLYGDGYEGKHISQYYHGVWEN